MATINGTQFNDNNTVNGGAFRFSLISTANADTINGLAGNDSLDGGTGADNMNGGDGIDTYFVDNTGDVAAETNDTAIGGFDTVIATVSHTLGSAIEDLFLFGSNSINGTGNSKDNQIVGNGAANILNGAAGIDLMRGGDGNDTYIVDNTADATIEDFEDSVAGIDTVKASVSYALSFGLNNLTLTGSNAIDGLGNELDNILSGNSAANILDAGQGKDTLKGGAGNDTLLGGDGNDTLNGGTGVDDMDGGAQDDIYIVDNVGDIADEQFNGNGSGVDTVQSSVSHTLGTGIENLTLTGNAAINGTGNDLDNLIEGNAAANTLNGDIGDDWLRGGNGNDTLFGGMDNDHLSGVWVTMSFLQIWEQTTGIYSIHHSVPPMSTRSTDFLRIPIPSNY